MTNKNNEPYFSIITVSYNSEQTIERTLKSVLNQTCKDYEYIIVDGASSDKTVDIIKKYEQLFRDMNVGFQYISEPDDGIYDAMNKGIRMSKGKLIGMVNSDDYYTDHALDDIKKAADEHPEIGIFHGIERQFNETGTVCYVGNSSLMLPKRMISHPTCFVREKVYTEKGLYDTSFRYAADYDFILRIKEAGVQFLLLDSVISNFSLSGVSQNSSKAFKEGLKVRKKHHVEKKLSLFLASMKILYEKKVR